MDGGTETVQFKAITFQISETNSRYQVDMKQKEKQKTVVHHDNNKKERKERND